MVKLKSSLQKFYSCHHDLLNHYVISVSQMIMDVPFVVAFLDLLVSDLLD